MESQAHAIDIPTDDGEVLGDRIRQLRRERGMSQEELAKAVGIRQPSLSKIEKGDTHQLRASTLMRMARALEVDPEYLRTGVRPAAQELQIPGTAGKLFATLSPANREIWLDVGKTLLSRQGEGPTGGHVPEQGQAVALEVLAQLSEILRVYGPDALSRALALAESPTGRKGDHKRPRKAAANS